MNQASRRGVIAAPILVAAMVFLWLIMAGGEADRHKPSHMLRATITMAVAFAGFSAYALLRSLRSGTLYAAGRFRSTVFRRTDQPLQYWGWFAVYCCIVAFILTGMIRRVFQLWPFI